MGIIESNCICTSSKDSHRGEIIVESNIPIESSNRNSKNKTMNCTITQSVSISNCEQILTQISKKKKSQTSIINYKISNPKVISAGEDNVYSPQQNYKSISEKTTNIQTLIIDHIMTKEEEDNIKSSLSKHFVFQEITADLLRIVIHDFFYHRFDRDQIIYEEKNHGKFFYIIAEGQIEATAIGKPSKYYKKWDCFGEMSLLNNCTRQETLRCITQVSLFCLDGESFRDIQKRLNAVRLTERFNFINTISLFKPLGAVSKHNITEKLNLKEFTINEQIIIKGDIGNTLYIIKSGMVSCRISYKEIRRLSNNDYFGQNAILIDAKRSCDVISIQNTICYEISRNDLIEALGVDYINVILLSFFTDCIQRNTHLNNIFIESKYENLLRCFKIKTYANNEFIVPEYDKRKKRLLIVVEGALYEKSENERIIAHKGEIVGDYLFKDPKRDIPSNIYALPDCITLEADFNELAYILHVNLNTAKPMNLLKKINKLKKSFLFQNLSENSIESIALGMKKVKFYPNDIIVEENTFGDKFYLISKGSVHITVGNKTVRDLERGNCFGEIALLTSGEKRTATVTAKDTVVCYVICKTDFDMILENKAIKEYLKKKLALQDTLIELNDLHYIKFLGKGKFGNVNLVHNKKNIYAIKAVSKSLVEKQRALSKYFINERRVMLSLDHPFIIKMVKTLKSESYCFYLMEFINGKNLDEYLSTRIAKYNILETQFFIGSLLLMLDYLQKKFIAHRDIKPSNIMIDSNGYLKMIDFGTAKILTDYTNTIIGTPHYIAPEILTNKGYSLSCDFWSVGICMYEIFYGIYPFGHYANDVIEIYKDILHKDFIFPFDNPKYAHVNSLIRILLMKRVNQRLCNVSMLKSKEFFNEFEWSKLIDFKLIPPYIPQTQTYDEYLQVINSFSNMLNSDSIVNKGNEQHFESNWTDEF